MQKKTKNTTDDLYAAVKKLGFKEGRDAFSKKYRELVEILSEALLEGETVRWGNLGSFCIKEHNASNHYMVDWHKTKKLWQEDSECREKRLLIYHLNEHTNYLYYKVSWLTSSARFLTSRLYTFHAAKTLKRKLIKNIKNGRTDAYTK